MTPIQETTGACAPPIAAMTMPQSIRPNKFAMWDRGGIVGFVKRETGSRDFGRCRDLNWGSGIVTRKTVQQSVIYPKKFQELGVSSQKCLVFLTHAFVRGAVYLVPILSQQQIHVIIAGLVFKSQLVLKTGDCSFSVPSRINVVVTWETARVETSQLRGLCSHTGWWQI